MVATFLLIALLIIGMLILLLFFGFLFERYSRWNLERRLLKGKTFINIEGKKLHYVKKGKGDYTIVFQSGMGSSHIIWQDIQEELSKDAVTIAYDRNGLMFSETSGYISTNDQATEELEILLHKTNCPKPYIIVGHSMAGIYLRPFIERNKDDIAGIVFAEAAHPQQIKMASVKLLKALKIPPRWLIKFVLETGIYRIIFTFLPLSPEIPINHKVHQMEKNFFYKSCDKVLEELKNDQLNFEDAEKYNSFGNIPLTVISGTSEIRYVKFKDAELKNEFRKLIAVLQKDLLTLSSDSRIVNADNSGHILQINDGSLLVSEIRKMRPHKKDE